MFNILRLLPFVCGVALCGGSLSHAQPINPGEYVGPFYGDTTPDQREEVRNWSLAFWNRIETGDPQTVAMTEPVWQSPLFNPLRATRATLERLKVLDPLDCDWEIIAATEGSPLWEKREALRASMVDGKFETDPATNAEGFQEHLQAIFDAAPGSGVDAWFADGKLVSLNLPGDVMGGFVTNPCVTADGPIDCAQYQAQHSGESLVRAFALLHEITTNLPAFADQCAPVTEGQKLITGSESRADLIERRVQEIMIEHGLRPATYRFDATFGVYGSIPVIQIDIKDYTFSVDGWSGKSSGLLPPKTLLDLNGLSSYWEVDLDRPYYRIYNGENGCKAIFAMAWTPYTINPTDTLTPLPASPPSSTLPGRPQNLACKHDTPTGVCTCTVTRVFTIVPCPPGAPSFGPSGCRIKEITTCTWSVGPGGCVHPPAAPNWPGQAPGGGWPAPVATCTTEYGW